MTSAHVPSQDGRELVPGEKMLVPTRDLTGVGVIAGFWEIYCFWLGSIVSGMILLLLGGDFVAGGLLFLE